MDTQANPENRVAGSQLSHLALSESGFLFDSSTGHTYSLNQTGTFILKRLIAGLSTEEIAGLMIEEYDISPEVVSRDLEQFLLFIAELGIIEKD